MLGLGPEVVFGIPGLISALTVYEYAQARAAVACGDFTPRLQGRLTLNPITHIEPWGLIALLLFKFGWGRPVMINSRNFGNIRRDTILVALSGPVANFLLALLAGIVWAFLYKFGFMSDWLRQVMFLVIIYNINFAVFNLLPIPPLDGSRILMELLPYNLARQYAQLGRYSLLICAAFLLLANTSFLGGFLSFLTLPFLTIVNMVANLIIML